MNGDINELDMFGRIFWFVIIPIAMIVLIAVGGLMAKKADYKGRAVREALRRSQEGPTKP